MKLIKLYTWARASEENNTCSHHKIISTEYMQSCFIWHTITVIKLYIMYVTLNYIPVIIFVYT